MIHAGPKLIAHCHCDSCGRDSDVGAASYWMDEETIHGTFGSAADFCSYCDEPYESEHSYEVVEKTLDRFDVV